MFRIRNRRFLNPVRVRTAGCTLFAASGMRLPVDSGPMNADRFGPTPAFGAIPSEMRGSRSLFALHLQFDDIPFMQNVVPFHGLPFKDTLAPDPCGFQSFRQIAVNAFREIQHGSADGDRER
jgi:hypothetical protein